MCPTCNVEFCEAASVRHDPRIYIFTFLFFQFCQALFTLQLNSYSYVYQQQVTGAFISLWKPSGRAVVTTIIPTPPWYVPSMCFHAQGSANTPPLPIDVHRISPTCALTLFALLLLSARRFLIRFASSLAALYNDDIGLRSCVAHNVLTTHRTTHRHGRISNPIIRTTWRVRTHCVCSPPLFPATSYMEHNLSRLLRQSQHFSA